MANGGEINSSQTALIEFRGVDLGYRRHTVLKELSFSIQQGDFVGIVGPNGSGKTTIVRAILGILRPRRGEIIIRHQASHRLRIGYVPQRDSIDQIMPFTVSDIVMMGRYRRLGYFRHPSRVDREVVRGSLRHVDIEGLAPLSYKDLSGGQKQRTLIARALAAEPDVLILDEPTNGMDLTSRTTIMELIRKLHKEDRLTIVMVSHLLSDVANFVKHIILVDQDFFQVGAVDDLLTEKNLSQVYNLTVSVGEFLGSKVVVARGKSV
jgi:ABC-type Mn2+/Zn2+ transport system ATPase subunit